MEDEFPLESLLIVAVVAGVMTVIMLAQLRRTLPVQNLVMILISLLAGEVLIELFMVKLARTNVTCPMWCFLAGAGLLWTAVVLSARRLGQFILRPWRGARYYGIWLLGVSAVLTGMFQFGWPRFNNNPLFVGMPRATLLAVIRGLTTVIFLVCLSPWFIRKRPIPRPPLSKLAQQPENQAQQNAGEQTGR
jgi:hypothetical protein